MARALHRWRWMARSGCWRSAAAFARPAIDRRRTCTMTRTIATVLPGQRVIDDGDMVLWRALPTDRRDHLGPFVFIDHYRHQSRRGIGDRPHPHAGIEVLSYLLEGSVEHRDSMGRTDRLGPGDAQHIRA